MLKSVSTVDVSSAGKTAQAVAEACEAKGANVRVIDEKTVGLSFGESVTQEDVVGLVRIGGISLGWCDLRPLARMIER